VIKTITRYLPKCHPTPNSLHGKKIAKENLYLYLEWTLHLIQVTHRTIIFFIKAVTARPPPKWIVWLVSRFKYTKNTRSQCIKNFHLDYSKKADFSVTLRASLLMSLSYQSHVILLKKPSLLLRSCSPIFLLAVLINFIFPWCLSFL